MAHAKNKMCVTLFFFSQDNVSGRGRFNKKLLGDKTLLLLLVNTNKINIHTDCVIVLP